MDGAAPSPFNKARGAQGHKTAGSKTKLHLGRIKWAWCGWPFSLSSLSTPSSPKLLWAPRVQHSNANFTGEPRRVLGRWMRAEPEQKGGPERDHDQQEMGEGLGVQGEESGVGRAGPWGWVQVRRQQKGRCLWMRRSSVRARSDVINKHWPEWKEQFMLCFIKMCIVLLF